MKHPVRSIFCVAVLTVAALGARAADDEGGVYRWVDEDGNVTYQGRPPPGAQSGAESRPASQPDASEALATRSVILYSEANCEGCDRVRAWLRERRIVFEEKFIDDDAQVRAELKALADVVAVPALKIGDQVVMGYNPALIEEELAGHRALVNVEGRADSGAGDPDRSRRLTREDLESMTPEEIEQAARDAALRGEDYDLFEEDEGFNTLNDDIFARKEPAPDGGRANAAERGNGAVEED